MFKSSYEKIENIKWPTYIRANEYVCNNTNFNSNGSILQKKPAESDFHVHAWTSRISVYFWNLSVWFYRRKIPVKYFGIGLKHKTPKKE